MPMRDAETSALCQQQCQLLLARMSQGSGFVERVRQLIVARPGYFPDIDYVAEKLNMTSRTLRRRLAGENSSYHQILAEVRYELAREYLGTSSLPLEEISVSAGLQHPATSPMRSSAGTAARRASTDRRFSSYVAKDQGVGISQILPLHQRPGVAATGCRPTCNPLQIPGPGGPLHARMYRGNSSADKPLIVYFHGGGWVIGDLLSHHPFCQTLSQKSGCTVISVDYRLAPEHPFPAAPDDCLAATRWVADHIGDFGPSNGRLVLAGDSAGANLATCTCLELDPGTRALVAGEIVKYPVVDHYSSLHPSYIERGSGQLLTSKVMRWFWDTYLAGLAADSVAARRAMPLHAHQSGRAPSHFPGYR